MSVMLDESNVGLNHTTLPKGEGLKAPNGYYKQQAHNCMKHYHKLRSAPYTQSSQRESEAVVF